MCLEHLLRERGRLSAQRASLRSGQQWRALTERRGSEPILSSGK